MVRTSGVVKRESSYGRGSGRGSVYRGEGKVIAEYTGEGRIVSERTGKKRLIGINEKE